MARYKLTIEYDGTGLSGWQRQENRPSVQGHLEAAVAKFNGKPAEVVGAGRTDAGVHALAQVAHADIGRELPAYNVMQGINYHLLQFTPQIIVTGAEQVQDDFHARFSAASRRYFYRIVNRQARLALAQNRAWHVPEPLDEAAMHEAARMIRGHHDFSTFRSSECQAKTALKTLDRLDVIRMGEEIHIHAGARSFLHHQVRNMVGSLRLAGNRKWQPEDMRAALDAKDRRKAGETAPADGLYLVSVGYEK